MKYIENTIVMLGDTEIAAELKAIYDFYNCVQPDFDGFMDTFGIACPSGCGRCCAHFIPDITPSEALIIGAKVLFGEKKDILKERIYSNPLEAIVCPFYDSWSEHHCLIYSVRPLVCRMFHSCVCTDKYGNKVFGGCRFVADSKSLSEETLAASDVKPMEDYADELSSIRGNSASTELLPGAVKEAVNRIGSALNLLFPDSREMLTLDQEAL